MDDNDAKKAAAPEQPAPPRGKKPRAGKGAAGKSHRGSRSGSLSGGLALILAAIALIAVSYLWYTLLYEKQELLNTDIPGILARLETSNREMQQALTATENKLITIADTQAVLTAAQEKLQSDLGRNRAEWVLAETGQLLLIANHRLQLARDVNSALAALRVADRQLELLANPKLLPVRKELAKEITLLASLEKTDIAGITLRLGTLADTVQRLPVILGARPPVVALTEDQGKESPAAEKSEAGKQTAKSMWRDILSLVRIRDNTATQKPLLPPEQEYFLRENLRLMLYGAQNALLQGDINTYRRNLKSAIRLLKEYFDVNTQVVAATQQELDKLLNTKIKIDLPDISGSLAALRRISGRSSRP